MGFFTGTPDKYDQVSNQLPGGQDLLAQLYQALSQQGGGGAFGDAADYYRNILSNDPDTMNQFYAPDMRKFQQETIPGLSEQFAGMGAGGLSSSGFRNAGVQAGTDLQERLASIRANLMGQAAQGLTGMGQMGLGNYSDSVMTQKGSPGLISQVGEGVGRAGAAYMTGGMSEMGRLAAQSKFGKTDPYGGVKP